MREAYGATGIYAIVVVLIFLFSGYLAFSVNRSRIIKVKNEIMNIVERANGNSIEARNRINAYLADVGYRASGDCDAGDGYRIGSTTSTTSDANYCIQEVVTNSGSAETIPSSYYHVTVFFQLDIPLISQLFHFDISGDTRVMYIPINQN